MLTGWLRAPGISTNAAYASLFRIWQACWVDGASILTSSNWLPSHFFWWNTNYENEHVRKASFLLQVWTDPECSRRLMFPEFLDIRHMKVVRLSDLRTCHLYPPGDTPGTHFCYKLSRTPGHSAASRIKSLWIEPATFRLIARYHNQLRHCAPRVFVLMYMILSFANGLVGLNL